MTESNMIMVTGTSAQMATARRRHGGMYSPGWARAAPSVPASGPAQVGAKYVEHCWPAGMSIPPPRETRQTRPALAAARRANPAVAAAQRRPAQMAARQAAPAIAASKYECSKRCQKFCDHLDNPDNWAGCYYACWSLLCEPRITAAVVPTPNPGMPRMTRMPNPNWWLIGGGVAAAAALGTGAYFWCRPRIISVEHVSLGEERIYKTIFYKGCTNPIPYEVIVSTVDPRSNMFALRERGAKFAVNNELFQQYVLLRTSFKTLDEARGQGLEEKEANPCCG